MSPLRKLLSVLILIWPGTQTFGQTTNYFSARQAVDYAMKNATAVANALLDIRAQQQTNRELTAAAYPQLQSAIQINDFIELPTSLIPGEFNGGAPGTYTPIQFGTQYNINAILNFSQLLFDGQVFVGLQAREAALEFATLQSEVTKEMVRANVYKLYYQLVVGNRQIGSIDANIDRFEKLLADTRQIYKNGFAEKLDVDKVSVQLNNLKTEKIKMRSQLDAGNSALKYLMNMPRQDILVLTDTITSGGLVAMADTIPVSYSNRREFQLYNLGYRLSAFNVKRYKLSALPSVSFFANYIQGAQRDKLDIFRKGGSWYPSSLIGLNLQMPIFNGMLRRSRLEKARIELQKAKNNLEYMKSTIDNDVVQASVKMYAAVATMESQEKNMKLAEDVYFSTKLKYEQGLGSQQEIYNSQAELKMAQNNYYGAMYDAVISIIDYKKATGTLD